MTEVFKRLRVSGIEVIWVKNRSDKGNIVTVQGVDLNPEELREVIAALEQALKEVDPPKYASGGFIPHGGSTGTSHGFVMPVAGPHPELFVK